MCVSYILFSEGVPMHDSPLLSIIVPVYNVEKYLCQCLDSILAQDLSDCEVLLIDDGSTDSSGTTCDRYVKKHPLFKCIHKPNGGLPSARKCGYEASRGQYVTFVDSDDWIAPEMYEKMCKIIRNTQVDVVLCNYTSVMHDREEVCSVPFPVGFYDKQRLEQEVYPFMLYSGTYYKYGISPNLWNKIFRRDLLKKHLFHVPDDVIVGEDTLASYSCLLEACSAYIMDEPFYYYRSNADSLSRRKVPLKRLQENHKLFSTFHDVIDTTAYPHMEKQMDYYFVYQSLLTYTLVFKNMTDPSQLYKKYFLEECSFPLIRDAFARIPIRDISGMHNRLYAFCIRHRLYSLFKLLLKH